MFLQYSLFQLDLSTFITKNGCECLNESDDHPLAGCLSSNSGYLESDCDEQVKQNILPSLFQKLIPRFYSL